jgi:PAS domain S-box-containing protein
MTGTRSQRRRGPTALRDLLIISLVVLGVLWAGAASNAFEGIHRWLERSRRGQSDEILFAVVLGAIGLAVFAVRLWRSGRREEHARGAAEMRFQALVEKMPAVVYRWDPRGDHRETSDDYVSPQVRSILGSPEDRWRGDPRSRLDRVHPEDRERVLAALERVARRGDPVTIEYRHRKPDGDIVWVREEAMTVERDADGRPTSIQGLVYDVTERTRADEQLAEAEARYRALVERVPAVTYLWDASYRSGEAPANYISPQVRQLLGYGQDEFGDPTLWMRLVHDDDRDRVTAEWGASERGDTAFRSEYRMSTSDGRMVWVRDEAIPIGRDDAGHPLFQGVVFDITERRLAEERLRAAEIRYRSLVEHMPVVAYLTDDVNDPPERYMAPGIEALLGFTQGEWIADRHSWTNALHPDDRRRVLAESSHAMTTGEPFRSEYRLIAKDGSVVRVLDDAREVDRDAATGRAVWQGVLVDVTARAEAEQRLRDAEERYRSLVEQLPVVVYQDAIDDDSTALYISPQYEQMFGYPVEARLADPTFWIRHVHPDDLDRVLAESRRTNATGEPFVIEYRFIARDGRWVWVRDEAILLRDDDGAPRLWQGVLIDVTERRLAEETLSRRDAILDAVGFAAERFLRSDDWDRTLPEVLERLGTAAGVSRVYVFRNEIVDGGLTMSPHAEWLAHDIPTLMVPANTHKPYAPTFVRWHAALSAGKEIHGLVRDLPGGERAALEADDVRSIVSVPVSVGGDWWGFLGFDDCLEDRAWPAAEIEALRTAADTLGAAIGRARAEDERRAAEQRYRTLVETIPAVTYMQGAGPGDRVYYVSPQIEQMLGYTQDEWGPRYETWIESVHPDDRERVLAADAESDRSGQPFSQEYRQRHRDGRDVWVRDEAMLIRDDRGLPLFWQGIRFDITAQRDAEQQVRDAEQRYRALVEHIPAVLYIDPVDESAATIYVSPRIEEVLGITQRQYLDEVDLWRDLIHPDDREWLFEAYRRSLSEETGWTVEYRVVRPDGRTVWIRDESAFLLGEDGRPLIVQGVMSDVTERKLAEEALQESERREREAAERLRTLDEMKNTFLAAVSHELRSPLTSILGLALTLEQQELGREETHDLTGRLARNARKLDRLLRDLLDIDRLSRGIVTPSVHETDLGELAVRAVESLEIPPERRVEVDAAAVVVPVDAAKVERIVENLVMNAIRHTTPDVTVWVRVSAQDDGAVIAVEDDGRGVPADLRDAIFEPFRQGPTASPHSPGTGIGLSLVAMFTDLHGGRAWVEERPGGGASFRVWFPATTMDDAFAGATPERQPAAH